MWAAIHKETGILYPAGAIYFPGLFPQPNVNKEKWIAPNDNIANLSDFKDDVEFLVSPWSAHERKNGSFVRPHFKYIGKYKNVKFVGESDEHKQKCEIINRILYKDEPFYLRYNEDKYCNKDLPFDFNQIKKGVKQLKVRKAMEGDFKEADVLVPFVPGSFWGLGLVVEIRVSETEKTKEEKEFFWLFRGFSIAWADLKDFKEVGEDWHLTTDTINVLPNSFGRFLIEQKNLDKQYSYLHFTKKYMDDAIEKVDRTINDRLGKEKRIISETAQSQNKTAYLLRDMINKVSSSIRSVFSEEKTKIQMEANKIIEDVKKEHIKYIEIIQIAKNNCVEELNQNKVIDKEEIKEDILDRIEEKIYETNNIKIEKGSEENIITPLNNQMPSKDIIKNNENKPEDTELNFLYGMVNKIKKERPEENIIVDEANHCIVWGRKQ